MFDFPVPETLKSSSTPNSPLGRPRFAPFHPLLSQGWDLGQSLCLFVCLGFGFCSFAAAALLPLGRGHSRLLLSHRRSQSPDAWTARGSFSRKGHCKRGCKVSQRASGVGRCRGAEPDEVSNGRGVSGRSRGVGSVGEALAEVY